MEEGDAAVDVVLFLPEPRRLPADFVEGEHRHAGEGLFGFGGEVIFCGGQDGDGHSADTEIRGNGLGRASLGVGDGHAAV